MNVSEWRGCKSVKQDSPSIVSPRECLGDQMWLGVLRNEPSNRYLWAKGHVFCALEGRGDSFSMFKG